MDKYFNYITCMTSLVVTYIGMYLGEIDVAVQVLTLFLFLDYVTGILSAIKNKTLNSERGFWGIIKKVCYLIPVGLAHWAGVLINDNGMLRSIVIYFFVANEGLSILENMGKVGVPLPKALIDALEQLKGNRM